MEQYINKSALVAEIESKKKYAQTLGDNAINSSMQQFYDGMKQGCVDILSFLNTLAVKEVEEGSLEKFKSLLHITGDLKRTLQGWGCAPNLYFCDKMWHVSWISCEEGDSIKDFEGNTPEEAIDKAYNWFHSTFCNS